MTAQAEESSKNDLGFLGEEYQFKLAKEFAEDKEFFKDLSGIVDQNMFTNPSLRSFVGTMKEYYQKFESVPSYDLIQIRQLEKAHSDVERMYVEDTIKKIRETKTEGSEYVRNLATKFFKQQVIIKTAHEILRIAGNGDVEHYDTCRELLEKALSSGDNTELGTAPLENLNEVLSDDYRTTIPTGVGKIDETLEGGLGKGELGVIIGSSSFGKVQPNDAKIVTPEGFRNMGDIKPGDYVMGQDGHRYKVRARFPHKNWPFYKVTFSDGSSTECGLEHLWKVILPDDTTEIHRLDEIMGENLTQYRIPMCMPVSFDGRHTDQDPFLFAKGDIDHIPDEYLFNNIWNRICVYSGLMDSKESTISFDRQTLTTPHERLAKDLRTLVMSLGSQAEIEENDGRYTIVINPITKNRYFESVEFSRTCDGQCILVESDDHLYLTDDFIVTHNTSLTTAIANYSATFPCEANNKQGYKVLQIVFEDRVKQIQRKHIARIVGVEAKDLSKPEYIDYVLESLKAYPQKEMLAENLRIVKLPSGEYNAWDIERLIKREINSGFRPDLVIVDYFECLAPPPNTSGLKEHEQEGKTMRKLEAIAGEMNIALWVPTQGTKDSFNLEIITMDKAGGSVKKIQIGHIVISIARSMEDIEANKATIAVLKNRAGGAGKVFNNVDFNNGTCRISTDYVDEYENMLAYTRKQKEDEKQLQREIFQSIKEGKNAKNKASVS